VVVIHGVEMLGPIHDRRQGFKTALVLLLDGDMSPIDLDNQVLRRGWALRCGGCTLIILGEHRTDFIRHTFDVHMIVHPPRVPIPCLQVLLGFSVAIPRPLFTVQGG
jgi:hypothetical protein